MRDDAHGSESRRNRNRAALAGYRVLFLPFTNGRPTGVFEEFLGGFVANARTGDVYGRPVGLAELPDGSVLVSDDAANVVWRVTPAGGSSGSSSRGNRRNISQYLQRSGCDADAFVADKFDARNRLTITDDFSPAATPWSDSPWLRASRGCSRQPTPRVRGQLERQ